MDHKSQFVEHMAHLRQDPLAVARAAAAEGARVVGYVGDDVPVALILAAGGLPVRLQGKPDVATLLVDDLVESSFAPRVRVIAEQWLQGTLDHLGAVIFTRTDDSSQRLYYYMCELQRRGRCRGPKPLLYDVASLARHASFEHTLESTCMLATALGAVMGQMEQSLRRVARRTALLKSAQARRALPAPLAGSAAWTLEFAASCDWREEFDQRASQWLDEAVSLASPRRVVLAGDPLPDEQLHLAIESGGGSVVLELTGSSINGEPGLRDPLATLADEFQRRESPALSMRRDARWIADAARSQRADAVVLWASEQNEALPWEIARQMKSLHDAGLPALLLTRQPRQLSAQVLEQVTHFVRNSGAS